MPVSAPTLWEEGHLSGSRVVRLAVLAALLLLLALVLLSAVVDPGWVALPEDTVVQAVVSGLAHRAGGLATAYALVLVVLVIRMRVRARHGDRYSKRDGSPAPTRVTSARRKSTTTSPKR